MAYQRDDVAILPTETRKNPVTNPDANEYHDKDGVDYIFAKVDNYGQVGDPSRIVSSCGDLGPKFVVGTEHRLRHDQTMRIFGWYILTGIIDHDTKTTQGIVPNRSMSHSVFK